MNEKLTSLAQLRMTAEKSKELSAQVAAMAVEAIKEAVSGIRPGMTQEDADARYVKLNGGVLKKGYIIFGSMYSEAKSALMQTDDGGVLACVTADTVNHASPDLAPFGCANPTYGFHAATKQYVDDAIAAALTTVETALTGV